MKSKKQEGITFITSALTNHRVENFSGTIQKRIVNDISVSRFEIEVRNVPIDRSGVYGSIGKSHQIRIFGHYYADYPLSSAQRWELIQEIMDRKSISIEEQMLLIDPIDDAEGGKIIVHPLDTSEDITTIPHHWEIVDENLIISINFESFDGPIPPHVVQGIAVLRFGDIAIISLHFRLPKINIAFYIDWNNEESKQLLDRLGTQNTLYVRYANGNGWGFENFYKEYFRIQFSDQFHALYDDGKIPTWTHAEFLDELRKHETELSALSIQKKEEMDNWAKAMGKLTSVEGDYLF